METTYFPTDGPAAPYPVQHRLTSLVQRKRANGKRSGAWIKPLRRLAVNLRDGFRCTWCERDLHGAHPRHVQLDHLTPKIEGGSHDASNLVTACINCNSRRQDMPWREWAKLFPGSVRRVENRRRRSLARYIRLARALRAPETTSTAGS